MKDFCEGCNVGCWANAQLYGLARETIQTDEIIRDAEQMHADVVETTQTQRARLDDHFVEEGVAATGAFGEALTAARDNQNTVVSDSEKVLAEVVHDGAHHKLGIYLAGRFVLSTAFTALQTCDRGPQPRSDNPVAFTCGGVIENSLRTTIDSFADQQEY